MKILISLIGFICCLISHSQTYFSDVTASKGFADFNPAFEYGCGVTAVDYNNDGHIDLYLPSKEGELNRLYRNNGNGNFSVAEVGISSTIRSRAALWFDYNGDHRLDLFIAGDCYPDNGDCSEEENVKLFKQLPNGFFEDVTDESGILTGRNVTGIFGGVTSGDINNDGHLDLITTYWRGQVTLFLNNGDGTFTNISESSGIGGGEKHWQPLLFDIDQNGWSDIFLPIDLRPNIFWKNNKNNTFQEIGASVNLDNSFNDMGVALGDFDNDDDLDLYITNRENNFDWHNVLLRNNGQSEQMSFEEISIEAGVDKGGWGWGVTFMDMDNNGLLDIAATNGYVNPIDGHRSKLWKNKGDGSFEDISNLSGYDDVIEATTFISFDYDRDGDLDIAQSLKENAGQTLAFRLFENLANSQEGFGNYLVVKPRMMGSNHWAIGSLIRIRQGSDIQIRPITAGISMFGQEPAEAFFGLADATMVDEITVVWPGGEETSIFGVSSNQIVTITDETTLHKPSSLTAIQSVDLSIVLNWGHMSTFESNYNLERSLDQGFSELVSFSIDSDLKTYIDTDLNPFTSYFYRVISVNGEIISAPSEIVNVVTNSGVFINSPTNLIGIVNSETSISLTWEDNADNETGYTIQRSLNESFDQFLEFDVSENTSDFEDTSIEPHTTYYYRVRGFGQDTFSEFGNKVALTTTVLGVDISTKNLIVYPNPTSGTFGLNFSSEINGPIQIEIANQTGQIIHEWRFRNRREAEQTIFSIDSSQGIYFLIFKATGSITVERLILAEN